MTKFSILFLAGISVVSFGCKKKGGAGGMMSAATDERDAMCKCTDKACADKVEADMMKVAADMMKGKSEEELKKMASDMSPEDTKKMMDVSMETQKCKTKATGGDKPAADKPADKPIPVATGDLPASLPQECKDYGDQMKKLASCDKMPQGSKDALNQGFDAMKASWKDFDKMPAEAQKAAADACKQGSEGLMQTGKAVCGW